MCVLDSDKNLTKFMLCSNSACDVPATIFFSFRHCHRSRVYILNLIRDTVLMKMI